MTDFEGRERREDTLNSLDRRFSMHEVVCAERYETICKAAKTNAEGLAKLNSLVLAIGGTLICGMATLIIALVWKGH